MADPARSPKRTRLERRKAAQESCKEQPCLVVMNVFRGIFTQDPTCVVCVHEGRLRNIFATKEM